MTTYSNAQVSQITPLPAGEHLAVLEGTGYNNTVCHTQGENILYQRSRFATQLPVSCRYTPSHFWLLEESAGVWRIGFTKLATWLLGDPVEFEFSVRAGAAVSVGQEIGWVEGLKALHTLYPVAEGQFLSACEEIISDITLIGSDPYGLGWLYRVRGKPAAESVDVHAYITVLDEAVDNVIRGREEECGGTCAG